MSITPSRVITRKRALISGSALLLIAGISAGGATITQNSTIFDNTFGIQAAPVEPGEVTASGKPMVFDFSIDDPSAPTSTTEYYKVTNADEAKIATVGLVGDIEGYDADPEIKALTDSLEAVVTVGGVSQGTANLQDLINGRVFELKPGMSDNVGVTIRIPAADQGSWNPGVSDDTKVVVDWQFDWNHK